MRDHLLAIPAVAGRVAEAAPFGAAPADEAVLASGGSATDPLNLVGILTPGPRIPARRNLRVVYRDGLPEREASEPDQSASTGRAPA